MDYRTLRRKLALTLAVGMLMSTSMPAALAEGLPPAENTPIEGSASGNAPALIPIQMTYTLKDGVLSVAPVGEAGKAIRICILDSLEALAAEQILQPGTLTASFTNLPAGTYTVRAVYDPAPGDKGLSSGLIQNVVIAPPATPEPTEAPTPEPTEAPTPEPTEAPTPEPTEAPTPEPTEAPTPEPTEAPTPEPTEAPTPEPTEAPTPEPTEAPTPEPTEAPTPEPTEAPTPEPTEAPTPEPTEAPTPEPTEAPTPEPTEAPTSEPTEAPTPEPTEAPAPEPAVMSAPAFVPQMLMAAPPPQGGAPDANGGTGSQPSAPAYTQIAADAVVSGNVVTVNVTDALAGQPLTATLSNGTTSTTKGVVNNTVFFDALADGSYTVSVQYADTAEYAFTSGTLTVNSQPSAPAYTQIAADAVVSGNVVTVNVTGALAGQALTATITDGQTPITKAIVNNTVSFADLADGVYTVTVQYADTTEYAFTSGTLTVNSQPSAPAYTQIAADAVVSGNVVTVNVTDALAGQALTATITDGQTPITKDVVNNTVSFADLADGSYTVSVQYADADSNPEAAKCSFTSEPLSVSAVPTPPTYMQIEADASVTDKTLSVTVNVPLDRTDLVAVLHTDSGDITEPIANNTVSFDALADGSYTVSVQYVNTAEYAFTSGTLTVNSQPSAPAYTQIAADAVVSGNVVTVNVTDALAGQPLTATITDGQTPITKDVVNNTVSFDALADGSYTVSVQYADADSNPEAAQFTFTSEPLSVPAVPTPPTYMQIEAAASVADKTLSVTVNVPLDRTDLVAVLHGPSGDITEPIANNTASFANLADGSYIVTVQYTDADSNPEAAKCSFTSEPLSVPAVPTPPAYVQIEAAASVAEKVITVNVTGALAGQPLTAMLSDGKTSTTKDVVNNTASFADLADGSYTVSVQYVNTAEYAFTSGELIVDAVPNYTQITADASVAEKVITVNVTGALAGQPLTATLNGGASPVTKDVVNNTVSFADLADGSYTVTVQYAGTAEYAFTSGELIVDTKPVYTQIEANASVSGTTISAEVTASTPKVGILATLAFGSFKQELPVEAGKVEFVSLQPGTYDLVLSYAADDPDAASFNKTFSGLVVEEPVPEAAPITATAMAYAAPMATGKGAIAGTVTAEAGKTVVVTLTQGSNIINTQKLADANRDFRFDNLVPGDYTISFQYEGDPAIKFSLTQTVVEQTASASAITATATGGQNRVDVSVTTASPLPVKVQLMQGGTAVNTQTISAGVGTTAFEAIAAGVYQVVLDYDPQQQGVSATIIDKVTVIDKPIALSITQAVPGENQITVVGTAQPNSDITLTTDPATTTVIAHSDAKGLFTASLVCGAGTYNSVSAQYGTDAATRVTVNGPFAVTSPAVRPILVCDPVDPKSGTVIAKTTPGTLVNLGTYDYGQTLTADSRGLLRYSLPHYYDVGTTITFTVYYGKDNINSFKQDTLVQDAIYYGLLRKGSSGSEVYYLTQRLADLNYPVAPTRHYNSAVASAVRLFQDANGLSVDGMAGRLTQTALYSVSAIPYSDSRVYPTLVRGDRGLALIYTLQQRLKDLGYYTIRVDGIYGSGTQRAVRWFQDINGLTVTGKADNATQQLLYSSAARPASGSYPSGSYGTLERSNRYNADVVPMQRRLKALGYLSGSVDGYFGSQTYRAVRQFQARNGLSVTGRADPYTQEVLYSSAAKPASGSSSGSSSSGYRLLSWGSRGEDVRRLQKALLDAGYKQVRTADGIFGQWTYDGVKAFQKDHRLDVDGIAGRHTLNALYGTNY